MAKKPKETCVQIPFSVFSCAYSFFRTLDTDLLDDDMKEKYEIINLALQHKASTLLCHETYGRMVRADDEYSRKVFSDKYISQKQKYYETFND